MTVDESAFCGYLGLRRKKTHTNRVYQRYTFLRGKFGLSKQEAWKLAKELEKWWPDSSKTG